MSFSSIEFVSLLPILVAAYWVLWARRAQNVFLLAMSALFLAYSGLSHLIVFLGVLGGAALFLSASRRWPARRRTILTVGSVALVLNLCYFKYLGWIAGLLGIAVTAPTQPLGISYYTFILLGFLLDLRNTGARLRVSRLPSMALFFPFLLSGPIVRLRSWSAQVSHHRKPRIARNVAIGAHLFMVGLLKKVLIADAIAVTTAPVWAAPAQYSRLSLAIAILGFYLQLYADFSGYTDMARGVARMMGFHLPINFRAPYYAATPLEFWSRWHMSLTGWIRDYVYTPLSLAVWRRVSSRVLSPIVTFALVVALMTLVGLWHGASNNFVVFGVIHGVLIGTWYAVVGTGRRLGRAQRVVSWALFQAAVIASLPLFRADTLRGAFDMLRRLVKPQGATSLHDALIGFAIAAVAVFALQLFEAQSHITRWGRRLVQARSSLRLFPLTVLVVLAIVYMKGLTLEGVWISPADPYFNQGQEKFIYLRF